MPRMRRLTFSMDEDLAAALAAEQKRLGIPEASIVRMNLRLSLGIERGAAGIDDASHARGRAQAARRSPRKAS